MQSGDAKSVMQTASENGGVKSQRISLKLDDDANIATPDLSSQATEKGLRPELKDFISRVVVPILVDRYLIEQTARNQSRRS